MLAAKAKRSAGVAPELNLGNPLHAGNKTCKQGIHPGLIPRQKSPEVQDRGFSDITKRTYVLQKILKKCF